MFKYAITDMIETSIAQSRKKGRKEGLKQGRKEGRMVELAGIIIAKLDQGFPAESIAYWLGKEKEFVEALQRLHQSNPKADAQRLVKLYNGENKKKEKRE